MASGITYYECETCKKIYATAQLFLQHPCATGSEGKPHSASSSTCPSLSPESEENHGPVFWPAQATKLLLCEMKNRMDDIQIGKITRKKMWTEISESLISKGFKFTGDQVMGKWKTLISALKRTKDNNRKSGSGKKTCPFQEELEEILDGNPSINPVATSSTTIEKNISSRILSSSGTPSSSSGTASSSLGTPSSSSGTLSAPSSSSGTLSSSSGTLSSSSGTPSSSSGTPSSSSGTPSSSSGSKRKGEEQIAKCYENNNIDPTRADRKKRKVGASSEVLEFLKDYIENQRKEKEEERAERARMHNEKIHLFGELIKEMKKN